jgi:hypothetical protein
MKTPKDQITVKLEHLFDEYWQKEEFLTEEKDKISKGSTAVYNVQFRLTEWDCSEYQLPKSMAGRMVVCNCNLVFESFRVRTQNGWADPNEFRESHV